MSRREGIFGEKKIEIGCFSEFISYLGLYHAYAKL